jgi:hypothetical protein
MIRQNGRWRTHVAGALLLAATVLSTPAVPAKAADSGHTPHGLPSIHAASVDGAAVVSDELVGRPVVVAFFSPGSVRAWRTLVEIDARSRDPRGLALVGIAGVANATAARDMVARVRRDYALTCPILLDEGELMARFNAPTCCDSMLLFDAKGVLRESIKFDVERDTLLAALEKVARGTAEAPRAALGDVERAMARTELPGAEVAGAAPFTVVTFFKGTCVDCSVSGRLATLRAIVGRAGGRLAVVGVFSSALYSATDLDNMKKILRVPFEIGTGDVAPIEPYMERDRFTAVRDARGRVIWAEQRGMSEDEVVRGVLAAITSGV